MCYNRISVVHILFKGIHFVLSYFTQKWNAFIVGYLHKIKKGSMDNNNDITRSIVLKR